MTADVTGPGYEPDQEVSRSQLLDVEALLAQAAYYDAIAAAKDARGRPERTRESIIKFRRAALAMRLTAKLLEKHGPSFFRGLI